MSLRVCLCVRQIHLLALVLVALALSSLLPAGPWTAVSAQQQQGGNSSSDSGDHDDDGKVLEESVCVRHCSDLSQAQL